MSQHPQTIIMPPGQSEQTTEREAMPDWLKYVLGILLTALVSYFTSEINTAVAIGRLEERQNNQYQELKESISLMRQDLRSFMGRAQ